MYLIIHNLIFIYDNNKGINIEEEKLIKRLQKFHRKFMKIKSNLIILFIYSKC